MCVCVCVCVRECVIVMVFVACCLIVMKKHDSLRSLTSLQTLANLSTVRDAEISCKLWRIYCDHIWDFLSDCQGFSECVTCVRCSCQLDLVLRYKPYSCHGAERMTSPVKP